MPSHVTYYGCDGSPYMLNVETHWVIVGSFLPAAQRYVKFNFCFSQLALVPLPQCRIVIQQRLRLGFTFNIQGIS